VPVFRLTEDLVFPPAALARSDGLLAAGGDLSRARLLLAYSQGIFPWYSDGDPILWWSPDPRLVLFPDEFHASRRLRREVRGGTFTVTMDEAFEEVISECAIARGPRRDGTWITAEMLAAYVDLHRAGYAHSVECWHDGTLAGGLYGLAMGRSFFGESMFSTHANASKVALAYLVAHAPVWGLSIIDCQVASPHLVSLGAREITRGDFLDLVEQGMRGGVRRGPWQMRLCPCWPGGGHRSSRGARG
jgi:leucyl/phenylalanyl-tRNA---protein transferase